MHRLRMLWIGLVLSLCMLASARPADAQSACHLNCTKWVSNTGTGTACTEGQPCTLATVVSQGLVAGDNVCMYGGIYAGADHIIRLAPTTSQPNGTPGNPIQFCSLNPTQGNRALLDGENTRLPILIEGPDYITIDGIFARNGPMNQVFLIKEDCPTLDLNLGCTSNHITIKNSAFWNIKDDAPGEDETGMFWGGTGHLIMDTVFHKRARKAMSFFRVRSSESRRVVVIDRGTLQTGFKTAYSCSYHSFDTQCMDLTIIPVLDRQNNAGGLFQAGCCDRMEKNDQDDVDLTGREGATGVETGLRTKGILIIVDSTIYDEDTFHYELPWDSYAQGYLTASPTSLAVTGEEAGNITLYCGPNNQGACSPAVFSWRAREYDGDLPHTSLYDKVAIVGFDSGFFVHSSQTSKVSNVAEFPTVGDYPVGESFYEGTTTPNHCFRWEDNVQTAQPLWPHPVTQITLDMYQACGAPCVHKGSPINLDTLVTNIFGPPPAACTALVVGTSSTLRNGQWSNGTLR